MLGARSGATDWRDIVEAMADYTDRHVASGGRANHVAKHMIGLFAGQPGSRQWRRTLSTESVIPDATGDVLRRAVDAIELPPVRQAA